MKIDGWTNLEEHEINISTPLCSDKEHKDCKNNLTRCRLQLEDGDVMNYAFSLKAYKVCEKFSLELRKL